MKIIKKITISRLYLDVLVCILCACAVYFLFYAFTGFRPWTVNHYNSYTLQALSWLKGRLDLGQNYTHLELAIFQGKYYVSFPPFPSFVFLPFAMLFGEKTPDNWIGLIVMAIGILYTVKLFYHMKATKEHAIFWSIFVTIGTNVVFVTALGGWVWFIAQTMAFTLSMMALYYAVTGKGGFSLAYWACSVGCRPMLAIFFPILAYLLYVNWKKEADHQKKNLVDLIKDKWTWAIPTVIIAVSYMILNYLRFGNIIEFGHNYLPEFMEAEYGQFNIHYIGENFKNLIRLPEVLENGKFYWYNFNGFAFWLISPLFISYLIYFIRSFIKKEKKDLFLLIAIPLCSVLYILSLLAHKTMGGWHFGNRYTNDILPYIFFGTICLIPEKDEYTSFHYPLFIFGMSLNLVGTIALLKQWI